MLSGKWIDRAAERLPAGLAGRPIMRMPAVIFWCKNQSLRATHGPGYQKILFVRLVFCYLGVDGLCELNVSASDEMLTFR